MFDRVVRVGGARERHARHARRSSCRSRSWARRRSELRAYIDGNDPITGRPVMQEVIEGLTRPLDDEELQDSRRSTARRRGWSSRTPRRTCTALFLENHWTDKLPIVLPTEERVAAMLAAHQPQARRGRRPHAADRTSASTGSTRSRRSR